ncbi:hypothetical protein [Nonomuraea sp. NPDC050540]|uniref:hypothetical protein n=1 Tax=Nonomuraea sp. NPDC050540 TaxID=3364367 RepID=UPI00379EF82B
MAGRYLGFLGILVVAGAAAFATRPLIARTLSRWGYIVPPIVLIGIGLLILVEAAPFDPDIDDLAGRG